jgi:hypothetical protein
MRLITFLTCLPLLLSAQDRPLSDAATLMQEVMTHQREMESVRENYTCHQTIVVEALESKGGIKMSTSQESEVFFVNHHQIARLVKKDLVELGPAGQKSEQNRVMKMVERAMKAPEGADPKVLRISQILAVSKMSEPRRVTLDGRDTLVLEFAGDPASKVRASSQNPLKRMAGSVWSDDSDRQVARIMNGNLGKKIAGTLWIDEADRQVARIEVTFNENFGVAGGVLASIRKGTQVEMQQSPVGDGLWMPSVTERHVIARVLLVDNIRRHVLVKEYDFKKFDVKSIQQVKPPA